MQFVGKLRDGVADRVRPDIRQVYSRKGSSENLTDRSGVGPMLSREAADSEAAMFVKSNRRLRKKGQVLNHNPNGDRDGRGQ